MKHSLLYPCLLLCFLALPVHGASGHEARADLVRIDQAVLVVGEVQREVSLPHILEQSDFDPDGSTVTYRLAVELPAAAEGLQAIYVSKVSLSARLSYDGQPIWACGPGEMSELRCLHQPHLIQIPASLLGDGPHVFEFEVHADQRQTNGLAPVMVGPYDELYARHYLWMRLLKVDLLRALGIFAGVTGLLSLAAGLTASRERVFFVFAAAAMLEALAVFLMSAIDPPGDRAIASWLIFSVRYVGVLMKLLLLYEVFGRLRLRDPVVACFVMLLVLGPAAMAMTDSSLWVVLALYLFVGFGMAATVVRMVRWTIADPSPRYIGWTAAALVLFLASLHDYLRLGGAATFDGVYLLYYVFPLSSIVMGSMLFSQMGKGLRVAQDFNRALSQEVADRTSALESALTSIRSMESNALSLTRNIPIGTFILQTWGRNRARYAFFSDRLRQMINLPPDAEPPLLIRGSTLLHPDDVVPARNALYKAYDDLARFEAEFRIRNAAKDWRWLRCIMLPQPGVATPVVWDGVVIDVTEARDAEERLRIAHAGLVEAAAEQSRMAEREHLLREMHDGFGSQLSSARLAVEQGDLDPGAVARSRWRGVNF
jgi:PAS domain-containing protein